MTEKLLICEYLQPTLGTLLDIAHDSGRWNEVLVATDMAEAFGYLNHGITRLATNVMLRDSWEKPYPVPQSGLQIVIKFARQMEPGNMLVYFLAAPEDFDTWAAGFWELGVLLVDAFDESLKLPRFLRGENVW